MDLNERADSAETSSLSDCGDDLEKGRTASPSGTDSEDGQETELQVIPTSSSRGQDQGRDEEPQISLSRSLATVVLLQQEKPDEEVEWLLPRLRFPSDEDFRLSDTAANKSPSV